MSSTPAATQTDPIPRDDTSTQPIKGRVRSFLDISLEAASNANDMTMQSGVNPFAKTRERYRSSLFFPLGGDDRARMASQTTYELLTSGADEAGDTDGGGGQPQSGPESFISSVQLLKAKTVAFDSGENELTSGDDNTAGSGSDGAGGNGVQPQRYSSSINIELKQRPYLDIAREQADNRNDMTMMGRINPERDLSRRSSSSSEAESVSGSLDISEAIPADESSASAESTDSSQSGGAVPLQRSSISFTVKPRMKSSLNITLSPRQASLSPITFKASVPQQGEVTEQDGGNDTGASPLQVAVVNVQAVPEQKLQTTDIVDVVQTPLQTAESSEDGGFVEGAPYALGEVRQAILKTQSAGSEAGGSSATGSGDEQVPAGTDLQPPFATKREGYLTIARRAKDKSGLNDVAVRRGANPHASSSRSSADSASSEQTVQNTGEGTTTPLQTVTIIENTDGEGQDTGSSVTTRMDLTTGEKSETQDKRT
ncbi:MAG: hypothetical protein ACRDAP_00475 [Shewanella sp.]